MVKVDVEYCGSCGHYAKYRELRDLLLGRVPRANVSGQVGRTGSFEVEVNKRLVHSKLQTKVFPDLDRVVDIVEATSAKETKEGLIPPDTICCIM